MQSDGLFTAYQFTSYIFKHPAPSAQVVTPMRMRRPIKLSVELKKAFHHFDLATQPGKNIRAIEYMLRDLDVMIPHSIPSKDFRIYQTVSNKTLPDCTPDLAPFKE